MGSPAPRWIGCYLIVLGVVHIVTGLILYRQPLADIVRSGVWNAVDPHFDRNTAFWFLVAGALFMLMGGLANSLESRRLHPPRAVGYGLALLAMLGVILMPISGFWLLLPPAAAMSRRSAG
jgi:uncharacterized membrane protein YhaH (DUF805 family)